MPRFSAIQDQPVLVPVQVIPPWTGPALRRNMAAIGKHGQARSAKSKCPRFQGNPAPTPAVGHVAAAASTSSSPQRSSGAFPTLNSPAVPARLTRRPQRSWRPYWADLLPLGSEPSFARFTCAHCHAARCRSKATALLRCRDALDG
jgi:hypothetical protein